MWNGTFFRRVELLINRERSHRGATGASERVNEGERGRRGEKAKVRRDESVKMRG